MGAPFNSASRRDLLSWSNSLPVVNHVGLPVLSSWALEAQVVVALHQYQQRLNDANT